MPTSAFHSNLQQPPFTYEALPPEEIKFVPLKQTQEFNAKDLMQVRVHNTRQPKVQEGEGWKSLRRGRACPVLHELCCCVKLGFVLTGRDPANLISPFPPCACYCALLQYYLDNDQKLKKYVPIIKDSVVYPVIYDSKRTVLSLPPIINSAHSAVSRQRQGATPSAKGHCNHTAAMAGINAAA